MGTDCIGWLAELDTNPKHMSRTKDELDICDSAIGKTAIKIYGFSGGIRPGVGLQGGIRATSRLQ